jgi:hypothetical protein
MSGWRRFRQVVLGTSPVARIVSIRRERRDEKYYDERMTGSKPSVASLLTLLCAGSMLMPAQPSQLPRSLPEAEAQETYAAYSALITKKLGTGDTARVLIRATTRGGRDDASCLRSPTKEHETEYNEQIQNYLERNRASYQLLAKFDIGRPYELVNKPQAETETGPRPIYISLSAVGFNAARDRAVIYIEYGIMGGVEFLTKIKGRWTVDFQPMPGTCAWIA